MSTFWNIGRYCGKILAFISYETLICSLKRSLFISGLIYVCVTVFNLRFHYMDQLVFKSKVYEVHNPIIGVFKNQTMKDNEYNDSFANTWRTKKKEPKDVSNKCTRMNLRVNTSKPSIAISFGQGRTANQLCYFATGYALWKEYGILNYISKDMLHILKETFILPPANDSNDNSPYYLWDEGNFFTCSR